MSKPSRPFSTGVSILLAGAVTSVILIGVIIGQNAPAVREAPPPPPPPAPAPPAPSFVSGAGFTLTSASIELPDEASQYPEGPGADLVNANCTSCHSASMALTQPRLTEAQWRSTVVKMRETYKAPIAASDSDAIVAYLTRLPTQGPGITQKSSDPSPPTVEIPGATG